MSTSQLVQGHGFEPTVAWNATVTGIFYTQNALQVQTCKFDPHWGYEFYNDAVSETNLDCWDTCPPSVGWDGAVKIVYDFFMWMTLGSSFQ